MNKIFKYKTNDEVWSMIDNRPQKMLIKDCILQIRAKKDFTRNGMFAEGVPEIIYSVYNKCKLREDPQYRNESLIFPTKEALISSL